MKFTFILSFFVLMFSCKKQESVDDKVVFKIDIEKTKNGIINGRVYYINKYLDTIKTNKSDDRFFKTILKLRKNIDSKKNEKFIDTFITYNKFINDTIICDFSFKKKRLEGEYFLEFKFVDELDSIQYFV